MDNTHLPPGGDAPGGDDAAGHPTEQFWPAPGGSAGHASPGPDGPGPASPGRSPARGRGHVLRWSAGVAAAALLAAGGAIAGASLGGGTSPAAAPSPAAASGPDGQAAALSAVLNSAGSSAQPGYLGSSATAPAAAGSGPAGAAGGAAGTAAQHCLAARAAARAQSRAAAGAPAAAGAIRRGCRRALLHRLALRGLHGEFTFRAASGVRTLAFERGVIESVSSGQDIVVRAPDGTTWTWQLVPSTVVRRTGTKTGSGALAAGEQVWAAGPVTGGAKDARLIVIRPRPAGHPPAASPAPAAS